MKQEADKFADVKPKTQSWTTLWQPDACCGRTPADRPLSSEVQRYAGGISVHDHAIAHLLVGAASPAEHSHREWISLVQIVIHPYLTFVGVRTMQATGVLDQTTLEGEWHGEKKGVQARQVVAFPY